MISRLIQNRHSSSKHPAPAYSWRQMFLALALVPLVLGLLLIITALVGAVVWRSPGEQAAMGGFYILFSFVASNALQKQWSLAVGWSLLGVAIWLAVYWPGLGARLAAAALAGLSVAIISRQFLRRRRQYLDSKHP